MQTLWNATYFAIFLIFVNLVFFIYLSFAAKKVAWNRKVLTYTMTLVRELLGVGGEVLTYDEEELIKEKLDDVEDLLTRLYLD